MMQRAVTVSPSGTLIVQAGPDSPRYAQCVWCGGAVELATISYRTTYDYGYFYQHTSDDAAIDCQKLRDSEQAELDKVLNVR